MNRKDTKEIGKRRFLDSARVQVAAAIVIGGALGGIAAGLLEHAYTVLTSRPLPRETGITMHRATLIQEQGADVLLAYNLSSHSTARTGTRLKIRCQKVVD